MYYWLRQLFFPKIQHIQSFCENITLIKSKNFRVFQDMGRFNIVGEKYG